MDTFFHHTDDDLLDPGRRLDALGFGDRLDRGMHVVVEVRAKVFARKRHQAPQEEEVEQLELFDDLQPIQRWLHVWDEKRRRALRPSAEGPQTRTE